MKLIDIEQFDFLMFEEASKDFVEGVSWILEQIDKTEPVNAILIPDNATNGDMIKALFPSGKIWKSDSYICLLIEGQGDAQMFDADWWNAPYKGGDNNDR